MPKVTVVYHPEGGSWWADSSDVDGLVVAGDSLAEVRELVVDALSFYFEEEAVDLFEVTEAGGPVIVSCLSEMATLVSVPVTANPTRSTTANLHGPRVLVAAAGSR